MSNTEGMIPDYIWQAAKHVDPVVITEMVDKTPNDKELGAAIRSIVGNVLTQAKTNSHSDPKPQPKRDDLPTIDEVSQAFRDGSKVPAKYLGRDTIPDVPQSERERLDEGFVPKPLPPLSRIVAEGDYKFCDKCKSGIVHTWFMRSLGCRNDCCENYYKKNVT